MHDPEPSERPDPPLDVAASSPPTAHDTSSGTGEAQPTIDVAAAIAQSPTASGRQPLPLRAIGRYELTREISRGGMGVVYEARDAQLDRVVALKVILTGEFASDQARLRFETEMKTAASLRHPNIVTVYDAGDVQGIPWFVMEYVEGTTLDALVGSAETTPVQAAEVAAKIADAVAHAHERGVLHRDLKPANVLVDLAGNPKVSDFGLAKNVEANAGATATGQVIGTPGYMPPEQAQGRGEDVSEATDVYGVGAVLYAMLAGRPPFKEKSAFETLRRSIDEPPVPLGSFDANVPAALEAITMKCLEKDPSRRYASASALADELRRWIAGEEVHATPAPRRRRTGGAWWVAVAVTAVVAAAVAWFPRESEYERLRREEVAHVVQEHLRTPPRVETEPHPTRVEVDALEPANPSAFLPVSRLQIWDFRPWQNVPEEQRDQPLSSVVAITREVLRKQKPVDVYPTQSRTTGVDVFLRSDSHPDRFRVLAEKASSVVGGQSMQSRQLLIDVSDRPVGSEFEVVRRSTYWNGCQRDDQRWIGTMVYSRPFKVSFLVIMPEGKPFRSYQLRVAEIDGEGLKPYEGTQLVLEDPERQYLFWEIVKPLPQHVYRVDWEW